MNVIILSKLADYGVIVATHLAAMAPAQATAVQLAAETRLPPTTVAKVLKSLARAELVKASRGATGGYRLARDAALISVAEIVAAIDGAMAMTQCTSAGAGCERTHYCPTRPHWSRINHAIEHALDSIGLDEMISPRPQLFIPASISAETHPS